MKRAPRRLFLLRRKTAINLAGLALLVALPWLANMVGDPFLISVGARILIYALAVLGLDLILGYGGMVSFGHAAFFGMGAFTLGILSHHHAEGSPLPFLPFEWTGSNAALVQLPLAMGVAALLALVIGAFSLRTRGIFFIMITLAFAQMLYHFMVALPTYGDGLSLWNRSEVPGLDLYDDTTFYYVCLGLFLVVFVLLRMVVDSRFGMVLRACKQNEARLATLGVPTTRYRLAAFVIAGTVAGLAGALVANSLEFAGPSLLHWTRSGEFLVMVILGGMGTLYGALAGAAGLLFLEEFLSGLTEHWMLILGPALIFVVLFARRGIYGWLAGKEAQDG